MSKYHLEAYERVWDNCFPTRDDQKDAFGRIISWEDRGKKTKEKGWHIDHIWPKNPEGEQKSGANSYRNVQPLHWKSNEEKANKLHGKVNGKSFAINALVKEEDGKKVGTMKVEGYKAYPYERWQ